MLGATDCMDGCGLGLGGDGKNPLEYSDTSSSSSSTTRKIITNPFPENEPSKRLQKPTPFLPYAVLRGLACQEGANRVLQKQNNRPVPANATRQGDRTKVRIGQFGGQPNRHDPLKVL